jgi:diguanylate cyclase
MNNDSEIEIAKSHAEAALAAMLRHAVPPTPRNYALWYAHVSGAAPELSRTLDILIANQALFTSAQNEGLLDRFLGPDLSLAALEQTERLQQTVAQLVGHVETATGTARAYGESLRDYSSQLAGRDRSGKLPDIVAGLLAETQRVAARNEQLESRLSQSSGEIQELRENLAAVRHEAMTDALTGINNRKSFELCLRSAAREAVENGEPLSLLFIDIDRFKHFNDSYGHQLGDQVLRLVARTLTDCVKGRDTAARYGGEEFAILLPQTRVVDAMRLAEQIRKTMMRRKIVSKTSGEDYGNITLSIGVSGYVPGETLNAMVERADAALYCAKRKGRNLVVAETDPELSLAATA